MKPEFKHLGEELSWEIKDKGYKVKTIAKKLEVTSKTIDSRLAEGNFKSHEIKTLIDNRYLAKPINKSAGDIVRDALTEAVNDANSISR